MESAASTVQAVLLLDPERLSSLNTSLRAVANTSTAADARLRDLIPFLCHMSFSHGIAFPENRMHAQMEILNLGIPDHEYNANFSCLPWIYIGKIRLLFKNPVYPHFLLFLCHRFCLSRQADHFFVLRIAQDLDSSIR